MKHCCLCKQIKPDTEFAYKNKPKKLFVSYCKECNKIYQKKHYQSNIEEYRRQRTDRRHKLLKEYKEKLHQYLIYHPCVDCGESDPVVLEFDHRTGKKQNGVSALIRNTLLWDNIINEIEKCEVRCANCHRKRHAKQLNWYKYQAKAPSSNG